MLTKPAISDDTIIACLHKSFGLHIAHVTFLPIGWVSNAVYRVGAEDGKSYFLKLRRGDFNERAVAVPAFLHTQGIRQKERDLMFIGGGIGGIWNNDQEVTWFYQGYGQTEVDRIALSYYRYERILVDIAECAEQIFGMQRSVEEREKRLRLREQFLPNNVVDIAHRSYRPLAER
jgi:hypothetical protein